MLTANQFHKQSGIQVEFQDFLQKMKISFGDNFMEKVNEGKVKLQEVQQALGLRITKEEKNTLKSKNIPSKTKNITSKTKNITSKSKNIASDRKNVRVRKITPQTKSASGLKCASCESNKNASGKKKNNSVRNIALALGIVAVLVWAVKNRK
jgi:hypothetical protein